MPNDARAFVLLRILETPGSVIDSKVLLATSDGTVFYQSAEKIVKENTNEDVRFQVVVTRNQTGEIAQVFEVELVNGHPTLRGIQLGPHQV